MGILVSTGENNSRVCKDKGPPCVHLIMHYARNYLEGSGGVAPVFSEPPALNKC
jgi:hypothetical protein